MRYICSMGKRNVNYIFSWFEWTDQIYLDPTRNEKSVKSAIFKKCSHSHETVLYICHSIHGLWTLLKGIVRPFWIYNIFFNLDKIKIFYKRPISRKYLWLKIIAKIVCSKLVRLTLSMKLPVLETLLTNALR